MTLELTPDEAELLRELIDLAIADLEALGRTPSGDLLTLERKLRKQ